MRTALELREEPLGSDPQVTEQVDDVTAVLRVVASLGAGVGVAAATAVSYTHLARTIRPATPHRTVAPRPIPVPRMEPVATWVVDKAKPR